MLHLRAIAVVFILLAVLAFPMYKYWEFLTRGMSPPPSTQILTRMETVGVPDFALPTLDGKTLRLSDYKGRAVIVNFWASWCAPCVKEFPSLKRLVEKLNGKLIVLAISNDNQRADLESFLEAFGKTPEGFIVLWDKERRTAADYGSESFPESYIIGPDHRLVRKVAGVEQWDSPNAMDFFSTFVK